MYTIIKLLDGQFACQGRLQDGTECWNEPDLEAAIKSMKQFALVGNHVKIKRKGITFLQEKHDVETRTVYKPWNGK